MKKRTLVAMMLALGITGTAFAGPFADVPAKHWAYDAVNKLAAAGIVDGYGDGTFRGDKTITRYEMAQIVAKAMEKADKADPANKALINKLAAEYGQELENLGVRVAKLENKIGNITWNAQVRYWYEKVDEPSSRDDSTRLLLFMNAPLDDNLTFKGRIWAQSGWGAADSGTGATTSMDQAYIQGKNFTLGRQGMMLGKGLVYAWFPNNDGVTYTMGDDKLKLTAAAFKGESLLTNIPGDMNIVSADLAYKFSDDFDMTLVYAKSKDQNLTVAGADPLNSAITDGNVLDTWAVGLGYKGIKNIALTGEYGQNKSDLAKELNNNDDAKGWVAKAQYKGAEWAKPHTFGIWAGYRDAEPGFLGRNGDYIWETAGGIATGTRAGYMMDDVKGADFGIDYTVFKNGVFTFQYFDLENQAGDVSKESFTTQLRYMF